MEACLKKELGGLLSSRKDVLASAVAVKGVNDRVDALTLLCREVLRSSSLCYVDGAMHCYDGTVYVPVKAPSVLAVLGNLLVDSGVSPTDVRRMGDMPLSVVVERSFASSGKLCFSNGVLDLEDGFFTDGFSRALIVTESLPYKYEKGASCPLWEAFLEEVVPDATERKVLQEFFGMVYLDRKRLSVEKFALFVGKGANGKSVIFEVMRRVLGPSNVSTLDAAQLTDEKMLPALKRKRLNFAPDMARTKDFSSALKALASGQEVTARGIFKEAEQVTAPPLCFALNEMPVFRDVTGAFFRRMLLFSFDVVIPPERQDRRLVDKICASDLAGIFAWVMEGRDRLARNGGEFSPSPKMDADMALLRTEVVDSQFPVKAFLESRGLSVRPMYEGQPFTLISQNEIDLGLRQSVSRYMITSELRKLGVKTHRSKELFYKVYLKAGRPQNV